MKKIKLLFLGSVIAVYAMAQKPVEVAVKLRDGSNVTGTTSMADINLITDYGKLLIPIKNVSSIRVGIPSDNAVTTKVNDYIRQMATNSDEVKKGAYDEIIKLGIKAIPALIKYNNDPKNTIEFSGEFTPDNALSELKSLHNISDATSSNDVLSIDNDYVIGGSFEFSKLDVKTEYGTLSIPKEKINSIDITVINPAGSNEFSFKLNASKNISSNGNGGWLKTGILLKSGQRFSVSASGEVVLASLSNQKYHPDGSYEAATGEKYPAPASYEGDTGNYPSYGQVVYKIGESNTNPMRAGAKFSGTANTSGMLYIAIYETVYNAGNSGSYNVKITLK